MREEYPITAALHNNLFQPTKCIDIWTSYRRTLG